MRFVARLFQGVGVYGIKVWISCFTVFICFWNVDLGFRGLAHKGLGLD